MRTRLLILAIALVPVRPAQAQTSQPPAAPPAPAARPQTAEHVRLLAQGWMMLAQGLPGPAAARAHELLHDDAAVPGALALAVEAQIVQGGPTRALAEYEQWLGSRPLEDPSILRRISRALLTEAAAQPADSGAQLEALAALARAGDPQSRAQLNTLMQQGNAAALRVLAEQGDVTAAHDLAAQAASGLAEPIAAMEILSRARSPEAVPLALGKLDDPRPEIRGAAADALGRLQAADAIPQLRAKLADMSSYVRFHAAVALAALGDASGQQVLADVETSDVSSSSRLATLEAEAEHPGPQWLEQVRALAGAPEPEVRLAAARLLAPHDPALARSVVTALTKDPNPAIRTMAADAALIVAGSDLAELRKLLHAEGARQRVRAAGKILSVTG